MPENKLTFEEALAGLEKSAADLIKPDSTLEEAVTNFEKGIDYYNKCSEILNAARQKVTTFSRRGGDDEEC